MCTLFFNCYHPQSFTKFITIFSINNSWFIKTNQCFLSRIYMVINPSNLFEEFFIDYLLAFSFYLWNITPLSFSLFIGIFISFYYFYTKSICCSKKRLMNLYRILLRTKLSNLTSMYFSFINLSELLYTLSLCTCSIF